VDQKFTAYSEKVKNSIDSLLIWAQANLDSKMQWINKAKKNKLCSPVCTTVLVFFTSLYIQTTVSFIKNTNTDFLR